MTAVNTYFDSLVRSLQPCRTSIPLCVLRCQGTRRIENTENNSSNKKNCCLYLPQCEKRASFPQRFSNPTRVVRRLCLFQNGFVVDCAGANDATAFPPSNADSRHIVRNRHLPKHVIFQNRIQRSW